MKEQTSQREKDLERDLYEQRQRAMEELNNANQLKMEVQREQQSGTLVHIAFFAFRISYLLSPISYIASDNHYHSRLGLQNRYTLH